MPDPSDSPSATRQHFGQPHAHVMRHLGSPGQRVVYVALTLFADAETGECWPSRETLAEHTGLSPRSVTRYVAELVRLGLVEVQATYDRRGYRAQNRYVVHDANWAPPSLVCAVDEPGDNRPEGNPPTGHP